MQNFPYKVVPVSKAPTVFARSADAARMSAAVIQEVDLDFEAAYDELLERDPGNETGRVQFLKGRGTWVARFATPEGVRFGLYECEEFHTFIGEIRPADHVVRVKQTPSTVECCELYQGEPVVRRVNVSAVDALAVALFTGCQLAFEHVGPGSAVVREVVTLTPGNSTDP